MHVGGFTEETGRRAGRCVRAQTTTIETGGKGTHDHENTSPTNSAEGLCVLNSEPCMAIAPDKLPYGLPHN